MRGVDPGKLRPNIQPMANAIDDAKEALTSMLGKLGFEFEVEVEVLSFED